MVKIKFLACEMDNPVLYYHQMALMPENMEV